LGVASFGCATSAKSTNLHRGARPGPALARLDPDEVRAAAVAARGVTGGLEDHDPVTGCRQLELVRQRFRPARPASSISAAPVTTPIKLGALPCLG